MRDGLAPGGVSSVAKELAGSGRRALLTHDDELSGRVAVRGELRIVSGKHHSPKPVARASVMPPAELPSLCLELH